MLGQGEVPMLGGPMPQIGQRCVTTGKEARAIEKAFVLEVGGKYDVYMKLFP
jgi:hypothetical protein